MAKSNYTGEERKSLIIEHGAKLASKHGAANVTRRMVAAAAKVTEGLIGHYTGPAKDAQKLYAARAKKLGLPMPSKEAVEAMGVKLRAVGPRSKKFTRKRAPKEIMAIKKAVAAKEPKPATVKKKKLPAAPSNKAIPAAPENKAAGRAPLPAPQIDAGT